MGQNNVPAASDGNVIPASDHNSLRDALIGAVVPRNASGDATDIQADMGTSSFRWKDQYLQRIILGIASNLIVVEESPANVFKLSFNGNQRFSISDTVATILSQLTITETGNDTVINHTNASGTYDFKIDSNTRFNLTNTTAKFLESLIMTKSGNAFEFRNTAGTGGEIRFTIDTNQTLVVTEDDVTINIGGGIVGQFTSAGMNGNFLSDSTVDTTQLSQLAVTDQKRAVKTTAFTNATGLFSTGSATPVPITDGGAAALTVSFTGSAASGKLIKIFGAHAGAIGQGANLSAATGTASIICKKNGTEIGRVVFTGTMPPSCFEFVDTSSFSSQTYTFEALVTAGNVTVNYTRFWVVEA